GEHRLCEPAHRTVWNDAWDRDRRNAAACRSLERGGRRRAVLGHDVAEFWRGVGGSAGGTARGAGRRWRLAARAESDRRTPRRSTAPRAGGGHPESPRGVTPG